MLSQHIDAFIDQKEITKEYLSRIRPQEYSYGNYLHQLATVMKALEDQLAECKEEPSVIRLIQLPFYQQLLLSETVKQARNALSEPSSVELCEETQVHLATLKTSGATQLVGHAFTFFLTHAKQSTPEPQLHPFSANLTAEQTRTLESTFNALLIDQLDIETAQATAANSLNFLLNLSIQTRLCFDRQNMARSVAHSPSPNLLKVEDKTGVWIIVSIIMLMYAVAFGLFRGDAPAMDTPKL